MSTISNAIKSIILSKPYYEVKFLNKNLLKTVKKSLNSHNYIALHSEIQGLLSRIKNYEIKKIFHQHNLDFIAFFLKFRNEKNLLLKYFYYYQYRKSYLSDKENIRMSDLIISTGRDDAKEIMKINEEKKEEITLAPFYNLKENNKVELYYELVSLGNLTAARRANGTLWFANKVFPIVKSKIPKIKWHIVGKNPTVNIKALNDNRNIYVHDFIVDLGNF